MEDLSRIDIQEGLTEEELFWEHKLDISGSVYSRMKELGISEVELADKLGVNKSQISRLITGKRNLTLEAIAQIEVALDFRLDEGFRYRERRHVNRAEKEFKPVLIGNTAWGNGRKAFSNNKQERQLSQIA